MSQLTIKDFVDYVNSQPKDKVIDHDSWHSCAIGEFAATNNIGNADTNVSPSHWGNGQLLFCIDELKDVKLSHIDPKANWSLFDILSVGEYPDKDTHEYYDISTYGGLSELLASISEEIDHVVEIKKTQESQQ